MKRVFLVSDQKGLIQPYSTFQEGKSAFDHMCSAHIKELSDNPTFNYKRYTIDTEDGKIYQFRAYHKSIVKGKLRFYNDIFTLQSVNIE